MRQRIDGNDRCTVGIVGKRKLDEIESGSLSEPPESDRKGFAVGRGFTVNNQTIADEAGEPYRSVRLGKAHRCARLERSKSFPIAFIGKEVSIRRAEGRVDGAV